MEDDLERLIFGLNALRVGPDETTEQRQLQEDLKHDRRVTDALALSTDGGPSACSGDEIILGLSRVAYLGRGAYSTVTLCRIERDWVHTLALEQEPQEGRLVACKVLSKRHLRQVFGVKRAAEGGLEDDTAVSKVTKYGASTQIHSDKSSYHDPTCYITYVRYTRPHSPPLLGAQ